VATAVVDGITTRYEITGDGPPLLMFSPGGFDSTLDSWRTVGIYRRLNLLEHLARRHTCISFDRRESGHSGGRVERLAWKHYVSQGAGLLDHLDIERAHLIGGCVGCSTVVAFGVAHPDRVASMVLFSPAGGVKYRMKQQVRLAQHAAYADEHGLAAVVALARSTDAGFATDPRVGPWVSVIRTDAGFATAFETTDPQHYQQILSGTSRLLFDRDTVPGAEPEDLLALTIPALVVPGQDESHATSAARYLEECLSQSQYWDVRVAEQTEETVPPRILQFLAEVHLS
jgi:pimeloyl-ACP methyl ester carboxylesterase